MKSARLQNGVFAPNSVTLALATIGA